MSFGNKAKELVDYFAKSAGITLNGKEPWDIKVHNEAFYDRVLRQGDLGLGESYMDGWWDCKRLDLMIERVVRADIETQLTRSPKLIFRLLIARFFNLQAPRRAFEVGRVHYDTGNELFEAMLDKNMMYSCGYWKQAKTLDEAQIAKVDLVCQKVGLKPGMRVLDIGCGWGGFANYAAEKYGVSVVGLTVSEQQAVYAREFCKGLAVDIRLQDYRELDETFDRVISIGMFEHVGHLNYKTYFNTVRRCLKEDGLFLLHTIGGNETLVSSASWIEKYIFPNGMIPSISQIGKACEKTLVMEDWQNFGPDYYETLMAWQARFTQAWPRLKAQYDERFYRMWDYYLQICAGAFKARSLQLWQIVFTRDGLPMRYDAPR